jgi:hypothetical protein
MKGNNGILEYWNDGIMGKSKKKKGRNRRDVLLG